MEFFPLDRGQLRGRGEARPDWAGWWGGAEAGGLLGRGLVRRPRRRRGPGRGSPGPQSRGGGAGRRESGRREGGWRGRREEGERPPCGEGGERMESARRRWGPACGPGAAEETPSLRRGSRGSHYDERSHLHDTFTQMTHALQELAAAQGSFEVAFPDAAEKMKKVITQLKEAQACIPPCGLQEFARRFLCSGCYSRVCDLPLDCPVKDVTVTRGDQAMFSCIVNFQLPEEEITYSWKFAGGGLRTQDLSYFRDMPRAEGYLARIRPAQLTHRGTFSCVIKQDQRPLARLYYFLNVTGPPPRAETELQASFREVLRWGPRDAELIEPWRPSLGELLARPEALTPSNLFLLAALGALASASATVLAWMFFRWYCSGN
ncbi:sperm acrosome membrane-associated protein 6 isoform X2 [Symphalangus syndactylus]|uniref:sperm acrosome membrane-associated protein 6 isoform X2 n=1 Tax=Symphalangus syndactylus TaxID=9590 RepID=UPI002442FE8C|nr:sperm acrosome membrane-associated protein 6 isoform X3 [Symphalangus syndactylus]